MRNLPAIHTVEQIYAAALKLNESDRASLVDQLLGTLNLEAEADVQAVWEEEMHRRSVPAVSGGKPVRNRAGAN